MLFHSMKFFIAIVLIMYHEMNVLSYSIFRDVIIDTAPIITVLATNYSYQFYQMLTLILKTI